MLSFFPRLTYTCSVLRQIVGLGAGEAFGIARTSTGSVWTWGAGNNGQLCHSSGSLTGLNAGKVPGDTWQNACSSEDYGIYLSNGTAAAFGWCARSLRGILLYLRTQSPRLWFMHVAVSSVSLASHACRSWRCFHLRRAQQGAGRQRHCHQRTEPGARAGWQGHH